jgi:hypothetical protein
MGMDVQVQQIRDTQNERVIALAIERRDKRIRQEAGKDRALKNRHAAKDRAQFWAFANAC